MERNGVEGQDGTEEGGGTRQGGRVIGRSSGGDRTERRPDGSGRCPFIGGRGRVRPVPGNQVHPRTPKGLSGRGFLRARKLLIPIRQALASYGHFVSAGVE